jgi:hypothetical protein
MKLNNTPRIGVADAMLSRELREHASQVNQLSEGRIAATYNASSAVPTVGQWAQGDFVRNIAPTELGSASSKYVVTGWLYTDTGFVECRALTGN